MVERLALSPKEFAALFGKSQTWAYRRIYAGDIRIIKGKGALMIPRSEADRLAIGGFKDEPTSKRGKQ